MTQVDQNIASAANGHLRAQRRDLGLTIKQAACAMKVGVATLQRAEAGISEPHPATAKRIADFYKQRVSDFWPVDGCEELVREKATA